MQVEGSEHDGIGMKLSFERTIVWPKDKDGNIIKPSWWSEGGDELARIAEDVATRAAGSVTDR